MQSLAFKTYLVGQCSKLAQIAELDAYLRGAKNRNPLPDEFWSILKIDPTIQATAFFADAKASACFFEHKAPDSLERLTEILSVHHNNGVLAKIKREANWEQRILSIESIEVGYMEDKLRPIIRSHKHDLRLVAASEEVTNHPHYRDRDLSKPVPYDVFLGSWKAERARLFDGNHRAIHIARQVAAGLPLPASLKVVLPWV